MTFFRSKIFWATTSIVFGLLFFLVGCGGGGIIKQYFGGLLIAVGIMFIDLYCDEQKAIKISIIQKEKDNS